MSLAIQPLTSFFLVYSHESLISLALIPVINGYLFFYKAISLSILEVLITIQKAEPKSKRALQKITTILGALLTAVFIVFAFEPLRGWFFQTIIGLKESLYAAARVPLLIAINIPAVYVLLIWLRSQYLLSGRTKVISFSTLLELLTTISILTIGIISQLYSGIVFAIIAFSVARILSTTYMILARKR